jgi:uncharacterized membrane protein
MVAPLAITLCIHSSFFEFSEAFMLSLSLECIYRSKPTMQEPARRNARIEVIDIARGTALMAMAVYHFSWDLEFFGYAEPGMTGQGNWKLFARSIASSFLFLVGVSLFLAHAKEIRWRAFLRRLAMVAGAALAISVATYFATPDRYIFFGILHQIALASVLGLAFLHLPVLVILAAAAAVITMPNIVRAPLFDNPALWWVGLSTIDPPSNDYVPLFPWFGAVLAGIAAARLGAAAGFFSWLRAVDPGAWSRLLQLAGRHSLTFYILHQPVLIGLIWVYAQVLPARADPPEVLMLQACEQQCRLDRDAAFCVRYCECVLDRLEADGMLEDAFLGRQSVRIRSRIDEAALQCTSAAGAAQDEESIR